MATILSKTENDNLVDQLKNASKYIIDNYVVSFEVVS